MLAHYYSADSIHMVHIVHKIHKPSRGFSIVAGVDVTRVQVDRTQSCIEPRDSAERACAGRESTARKAAASFLCLIAPLGSYLYGGLYGGLYERVHRIR